MLYHWNTTNPTNDILPGEPASASYPKFSCSISSETELLGDKWNRLKSRIPYMSPNNSVKTSKETYYITELKILKINDSVTITEGKL